MAKNTGNGTRSGAVKGRSQFENPNGTYSKRDTKTGKIIGNSETKWKGVTDEGKGKGGD